MTMNGLSGDAKMLSRHLRDVVRVRFQLCKDESSDLILGYLLQAYALPLSTPAIDLINILKVYCKLA